MRRQASPQHDLPIDARTLRDIFRWDVRTWSRALPLWQTYLPEGRPRRALAIGEREGGLSLWLALRGFDVVCTDLHGLPAAARLLHEAYHVGSQVVYESQDVQALTFPDETFDVVTFKSVLGALGTKERQSRGIHEMHRVMKPGGTLLFAENLVGTPIHPWLRRRFVPWDTYWRYLRYPGDLDLFAGFGLVDVRTTGTVSSLGRTEGQRDLLARLDVSLAAVVPDTWQSVLLGACVKSPMEAGGSPVA